MFEQDQYKALKSNDRDGRVIYCSSFSKTLSPGVRIGWVIAGRHQPEIERLQTFSTHSACSVTQMAVAAYLENGGYDRHLRAIRQEYRKNLSAFQLAVQRYFPAGTQMSARVRQAVDEALHAELRRHLSDRGIVELAATVATANFTNRINGALAVDLER